MDKAATLSKTALVVVALHANPDHDGRAANVGAVAGTDFVTFTAVKMASLTSSCVCNPAMVAATSAASTRTTLSEAALGHCDCCIIVA